MIYQLQRNDIGRKTIKMGVVLVTAPRTITSDDVGKVLRYRRERPANDQVDITVRETANA